VHDMTTSGAQSKQPEPGRSLLDDLRRPEAYPDPRPSAVTLVTTHISWVFLTDREVWKLKRPVDYGFVNYTTVERRRQCCEDEVRLNRRLAPDVYLGVVQVRLGPAGHWFGPDGEIVDYAVRMRRLSDDRSMEVLLRRGALTGEHLQRLASRLARFFTAAAPVPEAGAIEAIRGPVTDNFVEVEPFVGRFVSREVLDAVRDWQLGILEREVARFEERVRQGRIRDGHGDLRLEHVYFEDGEPIAIDCVEFSSRLRSGDAAGDVAFLAMELAARSRRDISSDRIRKSLAGISPTERAPEEAYSAAFSERTFDEVFRRATVVLRSGRGVILDATFRAGKHRLRARDLARSYGRRFVFVEAVADEATLRVRLRARAAGPSISDAGESLLERVRAEFEAVTELSPGEHVRVGTTGPRDTAVQAVLAFLSSG
jgi:aminoglycoside phosphotransferase family enzyme